LKENSPRAKLVFPRAQLLRRINQKSPGGLSKKAEKTVLFYHSLGLLINGCQSIHVLLVRKGKGSLPYLEGHGWKNITRGTLSFCFACSLMAFTPIFLLLHSMRKAAAACAVRIIGSWLYSRTVKCALALQYAVCLVHINYFSLQKLIKGYYVLYAAYSAQMCTIILSTFLFLLSSFFREVSCCF
jgi:hypothetical protein